MTLKQIIGTIEEVASSQPSVNMIIRNDVFRLNSKPDARYGAFAWLQRAHEGRIDSDTMTWGFTFFYVDRLVSDRSNEVEIQSVGCQVLDNIIRELDRRGLCSDSYVLQTFNQRFADECAGVFCNLSLEVPLDSLCPEDYDPIPGRVIPIY